MRSLVLILSGGFCCAWASYLTSRGIRGVLWLAVHIVGAIGLLLLVYGTLLAL